MSKKQSATSDDSQRGTVERRETLTEKLGIRKDLKKFTTAPKKITEFNHIQDIVPPIKGLNYQSDILFLPSDGGFKYLLVLLDLATNTFEAKPLKNKTADAVTKAAAILLSKLGDDPKRVASIRTDEGTEFKSQFKQWCKDNNIFHSVTIPGRHTQLASIDSLCKQLGNALNLLMAEDELRTNKVSRKWRQYLPHVIEVLNEHRKVKLHNIHDVPEIPDEPSPAKFKIGDEVYVKLDRPRNVLGHLQQGRFRTGDIHWDIQHKRKITRIFFYPAGYRYMVEGIKNASYAAEELLKV